MQISQFYPLESKLVSSKTCRIVLTSTIFHFIKTVRFHIHTVWLFLKSDIPTFIIPSCVFGLCAAGSNTLTSSSSDLTWAKPSPVLSNIPKVLMFAVQTCLVFDVANQSSPGAEQEDAINKPWRPIPAKRISQTDARKLLLAVIPPVLVSSFYLGVYIETCTLFVLCWMYNDLRGGDINFWIRNSHLSVAYFLYNLGSLKVAIGSGGIVETEGYAWTAMVSLVIFTTMHVQDMKDQVGDKKRGRCTVPLVVGDGVARWSIAVPVSFWMVVCPMIWRCGLMGRATCIGSGGVVVIRLLLLRDVEADKKTYTMWALWLTVLYSIPIWPSAGISCC